PSFMDSPPSSLKPTVQRHGAKAHPGCAYAITQRCGRKQGCVDVFGQVRLREAGTYAHPSGRQLTRDRVSSEGSLAPANDGCWHGTLQQSPEEFLFAAPRDSGQREHEFHKTKIKEGMARLLWDPREPRVVAVEQGPPDGKLVVPVRGVPRRPFNKFPRA